LNFGNQNFIGADRQPVRGPDVKQSPGAGEQDVEVLSFDLINVGEIQIDRVWLAAIRSVRSEVS